MRYGILAVVLALATYTFLCGCGTAINLQKDEQRVYGGVWFDAQAATVGLAEGVSGAVSPDTGPDRMPYRPWTGLQIILGAAAWVDLPLSIIGDTLTLPWTVSAELKRLLESHARSEK